ncbi:MAG: hypothetical protein WBC63_02940 [Candidatus Bipolaricaulia bacterium]
MRLVSVSIVVILKESGEPCHDKLENVLTIEHESTKQVVVVVGFGDLDPFPHPIQRKKPHCTPPICSSDYIQYGRCDKS